MSYNAPRLLEVFGAGRHFAGITPGEAQALARLSFPKIISGRSDDATRTRSVWR
jgi:hypothetical protein